MNIFSGFDRKTLAFFQQLDAHNDRDWFEKHRSDYDNFVLKPAQEFVMEMGEKLRELSPDVHAIPKIDKTIFRIHRDIRFSKDKTPYKTHLALFFWDGPRKKNDNSGYYLHIDHQKIFIGIGLYIFPKDILARYREIVYDHKEAKKLLKIFKVIQEAGYGAGGEGSKRVPRGYDPKYEYAELLKFKGIYSWHECSPSDVLFSPNFIDWCFNIYKAMTPLHYWIREKLV
ncbi:MAG TPA: DUF2461 domain-containing protein [Candidatus Cloacimonetes bacterium]|nr:DUF2461 domain-containing protein [Candidatus Cloacimonadota bacterium]